jgi:dTDP-4-amino-4,6-dideoxygalactose transaminase
MRRPTLLPYSEPNVGEAEIAAITDVMRSGWLTSGRVTQQFEAVLADYLGVSHVVGVSSCTAGLHLALSASDLAPGDEVITTPMTFAATINVIIQAGATPVLVDIDAQTGNIDLSAVEHAVTSRTRAVLPVHYGGYPLDMSRLNALRDRHGLTVIEDGAHALGTLWDGQAIGSFGNWTAFSFYATKNMTTGEGGALVVPTPDADDIVRTMSLHGLSRNAWNRYGVEGSWHYDVVRMGYKYNMTDIAAALGLAQLAKFSAMQRKRAQLAAQYAQGLRMLPVCCPPAPPAGSVHSWHLYSVHLDVTRLRGTRADVMHDLRQANIDTSVHFIPVYRHTYYRERFGWEPSAFPHTEAFFAGQISLPLYPTMTCGDVDDVVDALKDSLSRRQLS